MSSSFGRIIARILKYTQMVLRHREIFRNRGQRNQEVTRRHPERAICRYRFTERIEQAFELSCTSNSYFVSSEATRNRNLNVEAF